LDAGCPPPNPPERVKKRAATTGPLNPSSLRPEKEEREGTRDEIPAKYAAKVAPTIRGLKRHIATFPGGGGRK